MVTSRYDSTGLRFKEMRSISTVLKMALALGQNAELLRQIEAEETHPAMAAFGLWRDAEDLAGLADEIRAARDAQTSRRRAEA